MLICFVHKNQVRVRQIIIPLQIWIPHLSLEYPTSWGMIQITPVLGRDVLSPLVLYIPRVLYPTCIFILITGNGLVLYGLARFKILRHPSNIFVGVLSGIDMTLSISFGIFTMEAIVPDILQGLFYCQFRVIILASNLLASQLLLIGLYFTFMLEYSELFAYIYVCTKKDSSDVYILLRLLFSLNLNDISLLFAKCDFNYLKKNENPPWYYFPGVLRCEYNSVPQQVYRVDKWFYQISFRSKNKNTHIGVGI